MLIFYSGIFDSSFLSSLNIISFSPFDIKVKSGNLRLSFILSSPLPISPLNRDSYLFPALPLFNKEKILIPVLVGEKEKIYQSAKDLKIDLDNIEIQEPKKSENLERYAHLVYPEWVRAISSGDNPSKYDEKKTIICHAHYRNREAYLSGHIPGAIDIDTLALESSETWNRRSPEELQEALQQHGITADTTVVLYGKFLSPDNDDPFPGSAAGHIGAIRCAFIMMYAGVKDVRVLNGGFQSWKDAGCEISTEDMPKKPVKDFMAEIPAKPEFAVDVPKAKELLRSTDGELVCVRSWPEFIGELSGYNYIQKKGRIPGAVFGNCGTDAYHMENYRNLDHTTREYHEIAAIWEDAGITADKHLAFYCGTGWRGSEAFFNAWLMGWPRVSVFDGGWFEWSNDPENPYETGVPGEL